MEWIIHHRRMRKNGRHSSTVKLKFIHIFLLSIKINFDTHHRWKNCEEIKNNTTPHDHFLQCFKSTSLQTNRLLLITNIFLTTHTPPNIILQRQRYYRYLTLYWQRSTHCTTSECNWVGQLCKGKYIQNIPTRSSPLLQTTKFDTYPNIIDIYCGWQYY